MTTQAPTIVGRGQYTYEWNSNWAQLPEHATKKQQDGELNGRVHGIAAVKDGRVFVFNQSSYGVLIFNSDGSYAGTWDEFPSTRFEGAHGLTLHREGDKEFLWLTDQSTREVVKVTLDGETVLSIDRPTGSVYSDKEAAYIPTWAAQAADGTVFVADGYGSGYISRYDAAGKYIDSFCGDESNPASDKFNCPHGIWIGKRPEATGVQDEVIYVTDRANTKVQVYDLNWNFIKSFHQAFPCCFDVASTGELLCPDLYAYVQVYDAKDQSLVSLGENMSIVRAPGWPNFDPEQVGDGKFNTPHGGCFDAEGNIYIGEWIVGGRITKLTKVK